MDLIRRMFAQIKAQLVGLTVSQKLLIGLLALVMIATIFFTVIWSAKPQLVPLIPQPMTAEDINRVEMVLKGKYDYQITGDKVLVPAEQQYAIRGALWAQQAMPKKASAFTELIAGQNPFTPEAQNTRAWNNALQMELTRTLQAFPYVDDANVIVALGQQAGLGRAAMPSTSSVFIKTRGNEEISQNQVLSIVDFVTGTVSGMKRENVNLVVNGQRTYRAPPNDSAAMPTNLVEYKKNVEDYLTGQLYKLFSTYGDVKIAVNVVPDLSVRHNQDLIVDNKNKGLAEENVLSHDLTSRDASGGGGEPGLASNGTASTTDSGGRGGGSTSAENNTRNRFELGHLTKDTLLPAGVEYKALTASLLFPRSYFVSIYKRQNPAVKDDPDDKSLQPVVDQQLKSAVALAKNAIGATADPQINADLYDDMIVAQAPAVALARAGLGGGSSGGMGVVPMITQYAKQGVLAIIAMGVLGMMLMMVRRAVPAGANDEVDIGMLGGLGGMLGGKGKRKGPNSVEQLDAQDDVFGEANQGEAVLTGIELDDETLASRKMVDEVSTMIKENPENAAALVKRWMTKSS